MRRVNSRPVAFACLTLAACAGARPAPRPEPAAVALTGAPGTAPTAGAAPTDAGPSPLPRARRRAHHGPDADLDGDGLSDLVLRRDEHTLVVVPGSPEGPRAAGAVTIDLPGIRWNFGMATTGDFDGDELVDLAVGTPLLGSKSAAEGGVALFTGARGKLPERPSQHLVVPGAGALAEVGAAVAAGDFDGDGIDDLLVSAPATSAKGAGKVHLFRGGKAGVGAAPAQTFEHPARALDTAFGAALANLGDVDGDGIDDFAVGAYRDHRRQGVVYLYRGTRGAIPVEPWRILAAPKGVARFGYTVVAAGDVNGDGRPDLLVGCQQDGRMFLFLAGASGYTADPSQVIFAAGRGGRRAAAAGDINGDGLDDLLTGDTTGGAFGTAALLLGSSQGYDDAHPIDLPNLPPAAYFGFGPARAGDVDGDGLDDVVMSSHEKTYFWRGRRGFAPGKPLVLTGTTAALPTFSE